MPRFNEHNRNLNSRLCNVRASLDNCVPFKPKEANVAAKREVLNRRREFETNTRNEQLLSRIYKILTVRRQIS